MWLPGSIGCINGSAVVANRGCVMDMFHSFVYTRYKLVSILEAKLEGMEAQVSMLHGITVSGVFLDRIPKDICLERPKGKEENSSTWWLEGRSPKFSRNWLKSVTTFKQSAVVQLGKWGPQQAKNRRPSSLESRKHRAFGMGFLQPLHQDGRGEWRWFETAFDRDRSFSLPPRFRVPGKCAVFLDIQDVTGKLPNLFLRPYPTLFCSSLWVPMILPAITLGRSKETEALGSRIKKLVAQVVSSLVLPVEGKGPDTDHRIMEENTWLRQWCQCEGLWSFDKE